MKLFNFERDGRRGLGVFVDGGYLDATKCDEGRIGKILDFLRASGSERMEFEARVMDSVASLPRLDEAEIRFLSVVEPESKFMCIGQNYRDHCAEQGVEPPKTPIMFNKMDNALAGHRDTIPAPITTTKLDFEVELAVVIGRTCRRVTRDEAFNYVGGYTVVNDISARDHQKNDGQWVRAKSLDGFGPNGPFLSTPDEMDDPHDLALSLDLNGERMQDSNTKNLVFDVPFLISYFSQDITLRPGDMISTGTPPGVGAFRNPPVWIQPGDRLEATIEGLGTLFNQLGHLG